jgi:hypothetical protein
MATGQGGLEVTDHHATEGVAIGEALLCDRTRAIGTSSVWGLAQRQVARPRHP